MPDPDQGLKRLLQLRAEDLLAFALPGAKLKGQAPTDLATERQLVADSFFLVEYENEECLVNLEAQATPDAAMGCRLFEYGSRASVIFRKPVISIVLWLFPDGVVPTSPYEMRVGRWLSATWHFQSIELYKLPAATLLDAGLVGLLPLVPFTQGTNAGMMEEAMRHVKEQAPAEQAEQLGALLAVFMSRFYDDEFAFHLFGRYFNVTDLEILQEFPLFQTLMKKAETKAMAEGMAKGLEEGREAGKREAIRLVLESRFGPLSADVVAALKAADSETLAEIVAYVTSDTLEQVRQRLGLPALQG